jgi:hypothetical protein
MAETKGRRRLFLNSTLIELNRIVGMDGCFSLIRPVSNITFTPGICLSAITRSASALFDKSVKAFI